MKTKEQIKEEIYSNLKEYYQNYLSSKKDSIPVSGKSYDEKELISVVDALLDGWWTEGRVIDEFEKKFKNYLGIKHAIVVNSGSSANLLALKTLTSQVLNERRIKPGDEIITVAAGFPTTINPIIECGCIPVFCDVDIGTYNINLEQFKKAITEKTKAVFIAHTLGNPFEIEEIKNECKKNDLWLIEDACDALGAKQNGQFIGTFGDIATFSFYPAHHITMGEGGALITNNDQLAKIARSIRDWGRNCFCKTGEDNTCGNRFKFKLGDLPYGYDHKYIYSEVGYNLKNTELNAAIGLAQMDKLPEFLEKRKRNFNLLKEKLKKYEDFFILPEETKNSQASWFGFLLTLKENCKFTREDLLDYLNKNKIGTRLLFGGNIIKQPYFINNKINYRIVENLKNTDIIMKNTFWIGVCPLISEGDVEKVVEKIDYFLSNFK
jgi:CDP-6-deoxy-D-xylo-4-hexulose-3-dehydrase